MWGLPQGLTIGDGIFYAAVIIVGMIGLIYFIQLIITSVAWIRDR